MDDAAAAGTDNVFSGRFVLIKYNNDGNYHMYVDENTPPEENETYLTNYNIDKEEYGENFDIRGYDGTVWQKIYDFGHGSFINIAFLNGLMPIISLNSAAPTSFPQEIKFNQNSSYGYYDITIPDKWGFKIKEADNINVSDQKITQSELVYIDGVPSQQTKEIDADIYFNLKNANKQYKYSSLPYTKNEIILAPTGSSGKLYDGVAKNDYYELSIHLPAIGNMVSDGYDLIYGEGLPVSQQNYMMRPTDINWYNGNESDELKFQGNPSLGGKTYDLNTLAGSLNTIHNRLGQIIVPISGSYNISELSEDYIYLLNNKYYRKGKVFTVDETDDLFDYQKVSNLTEDQFEPNKYYQNTDGNFVVAETYDPTIAGLTNSRRGYFIKYINGVRYQEISLIPFESGRYYLKDSEGFYRCDNSTTGLPTNINRPYYEIYPGERISTLRAEYISDGTFYIKDENNSYISYNERNPDMNLTYYLILNAEQYQVGNVTEFYYYVPGVYYYKNSANSYILETANVPDNNKEYFIIAFDMEHPQYGLSEDGKAYLYYPQLGQPEPVQGQWLIPNGSVNYYIASNNGTPYPDYLSCDILNTMSFENGISPYAIKRKYFYFPTNGISAPLTSENIFLPNVYWEKDADNNYFKSTVWNIQKNYYNIQATFISTPFYVPETYYYKPNDAVEEYELDYSITKIRDKYYAKKRLFVLNDSYGICPHGYEWSDYATYIPPSITLYTRTEGYDLIELKGFDGMGENTINGNLLKLNKLYNIEDEDIRNTSSLNGALNTIKDILYQIKKLQPGHILYVNDFGQITSSPITYDQLKTLIN